jgi:hypothetical protein
MNQKTSEPKKVQISEQQKKKGCQNKSEAVRTIQQQQIYRTVENLYATLLQMKKICPVKYRGELNSLYTICAHTFTALSVAYDDETVRVFSLNEVVAQMVALLSTLRLLHDEGCTSNDDYRKAKSLAQSCLQQARAWRASTVARFSQGSGETTN